MKRDHRSNGSNGKNRQEERSCVCLGSMCLCMVYGLCRRSIPLFFTDSSSDSSEQFFLSSGILPLYFYPFKSLSHFNLSVSIIPSFFILHPSCLSVSSRLD